MDIEKKTTRVSFHNLLVISSTLLFITACGGGNNSSTGTSVTPAAPVTSKIGVFLDSPVGNIDYTTKTGSGVITRDKFQTNAKGEYAYTEGENITFSIGSLEFPPVKAAGVVTPLDIAGTNNPNDTKAVNMLRLLQTLDKDGDLGNGIEIDPQAKITASQVAASNPGVDVFSLPESEFVTTVDPLVKDGGQTEAVTELVSTEKAVAHVQETLEDNNITFDPVDSMAPVIKLNGENSVTVTEGETYTDAGATATDNVDGTVAVTTDNPVDTSKVATYTVTYTAKDAADNNATAVTRTVNVIAKVIPDTTAPVIKLNGESSVTITEGETYTDAGATATDNVDGTVAVTTDNPVDTSKVATYTVTYTAKDAADNNATAVTRTVNVIAANKLPIAEAGEDQVIQEGNSITLNGSATDEDGTIESYSWLQSGTEIGNTAELIIPNLTIGEYTFTLLVADDKAGESSDTIDVIVSNNCPEIDNPLQIDTDGDGNGDACDNDDDNDGFKDDDDPAPLDPLIPGDFSTPEAILNNSLLKNALDSAKSQGVDIRTETGLTPPDLTGYYVQDDLTNVVVATSDNTDIGALVFPEESRLTSREGNFIDKAGVAFYNNTAAAFIVGIGSIVRGDGNDFTIYSRSKGTCTLDGSDFSIFFITIASGTLDPSSGDILNQTGLEVTLDTAGALTTSCSNIIIGEQEKVGGWAVSTFDIQRRSDATNLQYMCVDESKAYAPTETWTHSGGTSCSCTNEYTVSCQ